ncbi:hypothetical protein ACJX0J_008566 [Zea mays]
MILTKNYTELNKKTKIDTPALILLGHSLGHGDHLVFGRAKYNFLSVNDIYHGAHGLDRDINGQGAETGRKCANLVNFKHFLGQALMRLGDYPKVTDPLMLPIDPTGAVRDNMLSGR